MRFIATIAAALGLAAPAYAYTAINGLTVAPTAQGFEVIASGGAGPRQIWCAAGQYAHAAGAGNNDRVAIARGYGPSQTRPGYRAVGFSLGVGNGPRPGDGGNYSVSIRTVGFNLGVAHAESFCADVYDDLTELAPWRR